MYLKMIVKFLKKNLTSIMRVVSTEIYEVRGRSNITVLWLAYLNKIISFNLSLIQLHQNINSQYRDSTIHLTP